MEIYALVGKSGTGKSYQAVNLCKDKNIESIIDDGLFICHNKVMAGISAKRQATKIAAVRTALFHEDEHMASVKAAIEKADPDSMLVLGTSDRMVDKIVARLGLHGIDERIYIEEITTEDERQLAHKQRNELGEHVIPAPTFQLKRQFSGYFMSPIRRPLHVLKGIGPWKEPVEKSVVRPTFSYLGGYEISEKVMSDIASCVQRELGTVSNLVKITIGGNHGGSQVEKDEGVELHIIADFKYGSDLPVKAEAYQKLVAEKIEAMSMFNVTKVNLDVRRLV